MARPVHTTGAAAAEVHLLPATINHSGTANVQAYFQPQETGATVDGLPVLECSLRGRRLAGVRLPLPQGYSGAVLECREGEASSSQDGGSGGAAAATSWAASAAFTHLSYYNHDAAPLRTDGLQRCLDWAELAARVHAPIDPAAVAAAAAAAQQPAEG